jgi:peptide/nickel transport system permease protein
MTAYILRRILSLIPIWLGISFIVFMIMQLVPGDPAVMVAGLDATEEEVENVRQYLGLNDPWYEQYWRFVSNAVQGDFGKSSISRRPVLDEIKDRFPKTVQLAVAGLVVSTTLGVTAGVISATRQYSVLDNIVMVLALLGVSMPVFWLGLMMMIVFSVNLGWLPTSGTGTWKHLVMPGVALGLGSAGIVARQTRAAMLEQLEQDYMRTAIAKGLRWRVAVRRHALRNAAIPSVTVVGLQFGGQLGGAVITETVFAWPGMGDLIVTAVKFRDIQVVQAGILILSTIFVLVNLAIDVLYAYLDPRIKYV